MRFHHYFDHAVIAVHFGYDLGELPDALETLSVPENYEQRHQLRISSEHSERLTFNRHKSYKEIRRILPGLSELLSTRAEDVGLSITAAAAAMAELAEFVRQMVLSLQHQFS
jgi:hypothetical protein